MFRRSTGSTKSHAVIAAAVEDLESRKLMAASPATVVGIKIAKRVEDRQAR
jgi:hypothetical protein